MTLRAADVMNRDVITGTVGMTVAKAAALMAQHHVSALPITDDDGKLIGILSEGDLMRPLGEKIHQTRERWLNLLAEGEKMAPEFIQYIRADQHTAGDLMTRNVITAPEDSTLARIADLFFERKLKRVPIARDGKVVGMVSRGDLIRAIANHPEDFV
jgi:CBS domain-containing protein